MELLIWFATQYNYAHVFAWKFDFKSHLTWLYHEPE